MSNIAFAGFGEINTPREVIVNKCKNACEELKKNELDILSVYPISDEKSESEITEAVRELKKCDPDALIVCVAGWIPTHAVVKVTEHFRHLPIVLWGLAGWYEDGRLITTADQAGTTALRKTFADLGYTFKFVYDIIGKPSRADRVSAYCKAASAARELRTAKAGMMGYRDMNLYGTMFEGSSLKRITGCEIECFEMLEMVMKYEKITAEEKQEVIDKYISKWKFLSCPDQSAIEKAAGYYLAISQIARERGYKSVSLKDVDGMKALLGFPPAPIFMLLADADGISVVPENDSLGCITQLMLRGVTGQIGCYLEFYEFFENSVLAGVPDFVPAEVVEGEIKIMPAAFGELSQGLLNVSDVKTGLITMCRLIYTDGKYYMHLLTGNGKRAPKWEECGWTQPAPQLPGLEIFLDNVEEFAETVASQHYFITWGDNRESIKDLCSILGIKVI